MLRWIVICVSVVLLATVGGVVELSAARPIEPTIDIPADLKPGNPRPQHALCEGWPYYSYLMEYCHIGEVYFFLDSQKGRITQSMYYPETQKLTLGELILNWGTPSGFSKAGMLVQVYWSDRYVYLQSQTLSPTTLVSTVGWNNEVEGKPWRGFVTVEAQ